VFFGAGDFGQERLGECGRVGVGLARIAERVVGALDI